MRPCPRLSTLLGLALALVASAEVAAPASYSLDTAFTYQGRLQSDGRLAEGLFDLTFELYDARTGGKTLGRVDRFDVPVRQGAFAAELDFGHSVYAGDPVWLEIQVRPAGEGAYTTLDPRHRLAGESVGTCTVNSDVLINGRLDIDPGNGTALGIPCCDEAGLSGGGRIELAGFLQSLGIDNNEIQSRSLGDGAAFWINPEGGNVGVGITGSPQAPLHLPSGPDVNPVSGGALVIGTANGTNLAFDNNEIMARSGGAPAVLTLNNEGGDVRVGGQLDLDYQIVASTSSCSSAGSIVASCPAGKRVVGGGCYSSDGEEEIEVSRPSGDTAWHCRFDSCPGGFGDWTAYAICLKVK